MGRRRDEDRAILADNGIVLLPMPRNARELKLWKRFNWIAPKLLYAGAVAAEQVVISFTAAMADLVVKPAGMAVPDFGQPDEDTVLDVLTRYAGEVESGDASEQVKAAVRREFDRFKSAFEQARGPFTPHQYLEVVRREGDTQARDDSGPSLRLAEAASREIGYSHLPNAFGAFLTAFTGCLTGPLCFGLLVVGGVLAGFGWLHALWLAVFGIGIWVVVVRGILQQVFSIAAFRRRNRKVLARVPEASRSIAVWSLKPGVATTLTRHNVMILPGMARGGFWAGVERLAEGLPISGGAIARAKREVSISFVRAQARIVLELIGKDEAIPDTTDWKAIRTFVDAKLKAAQDEGIVSAEAIASAVGEFDVWRHLPPDRAFLFSEPFELGARAAEWQAGTRAPRGRSLSEAARGYVDMAFEGGAPWGVVWYCLVTATAGLFAWSGHPVVPMPALVAWLVAGVVLFVVAEDFYSPRALQKQLEQRKRRSAM